jgi:hypothetical protein
MEYLLETDRVPDQEPQNYAGPERKVKGRMAHEAEAMRQQLGADYKVVAFRVQGK